MITTHIDYEYVETREGRTRKGLPVTLPFDKSEVPNQF